MSLRNELLQLYWPEVELSKRFCISFKLTLANALKISIKQHLFLAEPWVFKGLLQGVSLCRVVLSEVLNQIYALIRESTIVKALTHHLSNCKYIKFSRIPARNVPPLDSCFWAFHVCF